MKKLVLFIHGLGGSKDTWGDFENIIAEDETFDGDYEIEFFEYDTALFHLKGILPYFGKIGKILSIFAPQLPKIQAISRLLESRIEGRYKEYDSIYLVAHSMGGLVSLKYIVDAIDKHKSTKVKKLLLYDVPNQGSHLAKVSLLYTHSQLIQLDKYSDFLDDLNHREAYKDIEQILKLRAIICQNNIVVDKNSAEAHYREVLELDKSHRSIVKPNDKEDDTYLLFKNFILDEKCDEACQFIKDIFDNLSNEVYVLLYQKHTHVSPIVSEIQKLAKERFREHFYHFVTPQTTKAKYYQKLGDTLGTSIKNATEFKEVMGALAQKHDVLLYINDFEDNDEARALELSTAIRKLKNNYPHFHAIIIGEEKLALMAYRSDATLSPLNTAEKKIFPNNTKLDKTNIINLIKNLESYDIPIIKEYIDGDIGDFDISDTLKMKLFWCNILNNSKDDTLCWKDEETRQVFERLMA